MTKQDLKQLADEMGMTPDETAHMLVDCGDIDSTEHAELLSETERRRIYGE